MLINLRNALMSGKRTPTAKDYVQSGLVAMWDGIENAGWGVHDAAAGTWKDLTGNGFDAIASSGMDFVSWGDYSANATSNTGLVADGGISFTNRNITAEIISNWTIAGNNIGILALNRQASNYNNQTIGFRCAGNNLYASYGGGQVNAGVTGVLRVSAVIEETPGSSSVTITIYRDGNIISTKTITPSALYTGSFVEILKTNASAWRGGFAGSINAIRLYNRSLTADEIAANYAVDVQRFNIPTT